MPWIDFFIGGLGICAVVGPGQLEARYRIMAAASIALAAFDLGTKIGYAH